MKFLRDLKDSFLIALMLIIFGVCVYQGVTEAWNELKHHWYLEALGKLFTWPWGGFMVAMFLSQFLEESEDKDPFMFERIWNDKIPPFRPRDSLPKE